MPVPGAKNDYRDYEKFVADALIGGLVAGSCVGDEELDKENHVMVPDFVTRISPNGELPFCSLNELPFDAADIIRKRHCRRNGIEGFYAEEGYLLQRKLIEKWMREQLILSGGEPRSESPIYMILGDPQEGDFDIRKDIQKQGIQYQIDLSKLNLNSVTFTYPDSMYELVYDEDNVIVDGIRTNTPKVYRYGDLASLIENRHVYDPYVHYIEVQVWDRLRLNQVWDNKEFRIIEG